MTATSRPAAAKINGHVPLSLIHSSGKQDGDFLSIRPVKGAAVWRHAADAGHKTGPASVRIKEFHLFLPTFLKEFIWFSNYPNYLKIHREFLKIELIYIWLGIVQRCHLFKMRRRFRSVTFRVSLRRSELKMNETGNEVPKRLVVKLEN